MISAFRSLRSVNWCESAAGRDLWVAAINEKGCQWQREGQSQGSRVVTDSKYQRSPDVVWIAYLDAKAMSPVKISGFPNMDCMSWTEMCEACELDRLDVAVRKLDANCVATTVDFQDLRNLPGPNPGGRTEQSSRVNTIFSPGDSQTGLRGWLN